MKPRYLPSTPKSLSVMRKSSRYAGRNVNGARNSIGIFVTAQSDGGIAASRSPAMRSCYLPFYLSTEKVSIWRIEKIRRHLGRRVLAFTLWASTRGRVAALQAARVIVSSDEQKGCRPDPIIRPYPVDTQKANQIQKLRRLRHRLGRQFRRKEVF